MFQIGLFLLSLGLVGTIFGQSEKQLISESGNSQYRHSQSEFEFASISFHPHKTKDIYILSGLGADDRVFKHLNFSGFNPNFIKWNPPLKNEPIGDYALRLSEQIPTKRPVLVGLSFGGIMAIEISKHIETEKIILISSAKTTKELPVYFRIYGLLGLHKLFSPTGLKKSDPGTNWMFGTESKEDEALLTEILRDTDPVFFEWAIDKLLKWKNYEIPDNLHHIHGTADHILPIGFVKADHKVKNGGHFMVLNKPIEISSILRKLF